MGLGTSEDAYNLTHIKNNNGRLKPNSNASNETTSNDLTKSVSRLSKHLNNHTTEINSTTYNNSPFAANSVSNIPGNESAEEGPCR